jgi:transcriptional regulator of arginine metabolism
MKAWRQSQILEVVDGEAVSSQAVLRDKLQARGIEATQATLSRDLKELGLVKRAGDGAYTRPGHEKSNGHAASERLRRAVPATVRGLERVNLLLIVRTDPGQAQGLAVLVDRSQFAEVAGTVAGDDTILVICRGLEQAKQMEARLTSMVRGKE